jgi:hypothetical protein
MSPSPLAPVRVGAYTLETEASAESFARFEPESEDENARALGAALASGPDEDALMEELEGLEDTAEAVTRRIERADEIVRAAADGQLLEADHLTGEVDLLLALFRRLDRQGRFEEELRLARALNRLLALVLRWLELVRMLRMTLRSAQASNQLSGQAWALHELGTLHLCAGDPETAAQQLGEASRLEQSLGASAGTCATRHNLDAARRDVAFRAGAIGWRRRLLRLAGLTAVLAVLGAGGTAIARALGDGHHGATTGAASGPTSTGTTSAGGRLTSGTGTTSVTDTTPPAISLLAPVDGAMLSTATPELSGHAGTETGDLPSVLVLLADDQGNPVAGFPRTASAREGLWAVTPTTALPDGSYRVSAQQRDETGNKGTSTTTMFTVDTRAPVLTLRCPNSLLSVNVCDLTSTDAGPARVDIYEVFTNPDQTSFERRLPDSQTIELEADIAGHVTLTLPKLTGNAMGFRLVGVQSDAAGNEGTSNSESLEPVS